jgi:membrane fusion protein (multidrug efflux system)
MRQGSITNNRGSSGFSYGQEGYGERAVIPVEVTSSMLAVIRERVRGSGILEPERQVNLLSRVEGSVDFVAVEEGQLVKEGKVLCAIDQEELRISERVALIEKEQAEAGLARMEGLAKTRAGTTKELDDARFTLRKAEASHARALIDLAHSQPEALFDAIIIRRRIEPGQYVRVGDELFAFADFEPLRVRLYLPESEIENLELGQRCALRSESDGPVLAEGTVERISPVVDRESLTVEILTSFPDAAVLLRPGSFVHVDIITRTLENRIVVPRAAFLRNDGRSRVFRLLEDGETVQEIEVVSGYENESIIVIEEGLALGDRVVVQGLEDLRDRDKVSVYREIPVQVDSLTVERLDSAPSEMESGERTRPNRARRPGDEGGNKGSPATSQGTTGATESDSSGAADSGGSGSSGG